jgi:hypothetical protein
MARDLSFDERKRQRDIEDQEDEALRELKKSGTPIAGRMGLSKSGDVAIDRLVECFQRSEPMIEQLNNLYNQYIAGVDTHPPIERRKQLDQMMALLQGMAKPGPAYQFRYMTLNASYVTHRERWDRLMKDLESGKLKRIAGPKRNR